MQNGCQFYIKFHEESKNELDINFRRIYEHKRSLPNDGHLKI